MRRADRLMKIAHFLRSRRRAVTAQQIGDEFDICTRTVYRDIQELLNLGTPIQGEAGVGYVIDKQYYLPPVTFDTEELEAIGLGISMVSQLTDDKFSLKAKSAFAKIQAVLPAPLQGELEQITTYSRTGPATLPWTVSFSELRESIRKRNKLRILYADETQQVSTRVLRPLALIFFSPGWLLAGWCETRQDFRNFRIDRIQSMERLDEIFVDQPDKDLAAYKVKHASF